MNKSCGLVVLFAPAILAASAGFRAGVARVDITPPAGHPMGGYAARVSPASGIHDPLYATVLVLENGEATLALVTCDLRSFVSTRVGELARQRYGISHTVVSSSHTHSGPLTWEAKTPWYAETEAKMVDAIGAARSAMFNAEIAAGSGEIYLGFNRRRVVDGKIQMWWRNAEKAPSHPIDPTVTILRIRDTQQKLRAVVVNYACHPSVLGPDNLQFSADYPGALRRFVEREIPGAMCLFVQGAAGDINPYRDKEPVSGEGFQAVEQMGTELGSRVISLLDAAKPAEPATMALSSEVLQVGHRSNTSAVIRVGLTAGVIGNRVCLLALPGEAFVEHQITFRQKSECATTLFLGYSYSAGGEWAGYLPTIRAAAEGGYGAGYNTTVEVGAGEMLVDRGIVHLFKLRGFLKDVPETRF